MHRIELFSLYLCQNNQKLKNMDRINRIKVVLAEKQRTNKWLANQRDGSFGLCWHVSAQTAMY